MRLQTSFALIALIGACKADHNLGSLDGVDAASATKDTASNLDSASAIADTAVPGAADTGQTTPSTTPPDSAAEAAIPADAALAAQAWTGYIELVKFQSGSDAVRLRFSASAGGQVKGTIVFGKNAPPPAATDPAAWYPPDGYESWPALEGFPYTMNDATFVAGRLQFSINRQEILASWCKVQTPVPGTDQCLAFQGAGFTKPSPDPRSNECYFINNQVTDAGDPMPIQPVSCAQAQMCLIDNVCECSISACNLRVEMNTNDKFDIMLANGAGNGSTNQLGGTGGNLHFVQDP